MTTILKVLVGSRAHGLAGPDSDFDYRGVFLHKTSTLLSIGEKPKDTSWIEADKKAGEKDDATAWELGHFLHLATKCNPTILEVFAAPVESANIYGMQLRDLFPYVWNPKGVRDAFIGYGHNQRTKFFKDEDKRAPKYAVAYLRVLYQAYILLSTSKLIVDMTETPVYDRLKLWRAGNFTKGEVIDITEEWQEAVDQAYSHCKHTPDLEAVNRFLLFVRRRNW